MKIYALADLFEMVFRGFLHHLHAIFKVVFLEQKSVDFDGGKEMDV